MRARLKLDIVGIPEAVAAMRRELADCLREVARTEVPDVAGRLREIAAAFECGQTSEAADD